MGWGRRIVAALIGLMALALGAWLISLIALVYLALSFRRPRAVTLSQGPVERPGVPWGRYAVGGALFLVAALAAGEGGRLSPVVFFSAGVASLAWPALHSLPATNRVVPVRESILLRSRFLPIRWHCLVEVKLEAQGQARGVAGMEGTLLVFAAKTPAAFQVLSVYALGHRRAEEKVIRALQRETRMLSQRGAHLLPLDSGDAGRRLALRLRRLRIGSEDLEAVSSLPFDVFTLQAREGLVVRHRAFMISEPDGQASLPLPDISAARRPLLAEVVEEIGEKHGWPGPDVFSPFLASLDATRSEPVADRFRMKGEDAGLLVVETLGGAEVRLARSQLRAVARIYA